MLYIVYYKVCFWLKFFENFVENISFIKDFIVFKFLDKGNEKKYLFFFFKVKVKYIKCYCSYFSKLYYVDFIFIKFLKIYNKLGGIFIVYRKIDYKCIFIYVNIDKCFI